MQKDAFLSCAMEQERTLYRVAKTMLRSDADCADAVQEALLRGIKGAPMIRSEQYAKTWLTRILINVCRDLLRKQSRNRTAELSELYPAPDDTEQRELYDALRALDEKLRLPLTLHYLEGFSIREIARMLRVPEGTVKRRLFEARKEMRETLTEEAI
ncbi:MAG: sigma-70 family RNA polymerase sigma factor [Clostridia bacterium]|nr:sigma-70 family RNA polymerase sigma factor [Clostridia bacterium]